MAIGYQRREIKGFPDLATGTAWISQHQLALEQQTDAQAHSEIQCLGLSEYSELEKYYVKHERMRNMRVRFENCERDRVIEIVHFRLYTPPDHSYLYADVRAPICNELLRHLAQEETEFSYCSRSIDMQALRQELETTVVGGWFGNLKIANVSSASVQGPTVIESEDWRRYERHGTISALAMYVEYLGALRRVMVSEKGAIVVFGKLAEGPALELVTKVDQLVTPHTTTPDVGWKGGTTPE